MNDVNMNSLTASIKALQPAPMSNAEAKEAASNLLAFMELLIEIDREHGITSASQSKARI